MALSFGDVREYLSKVLSCQRQSHPMSLYSISINHNRFDSSVINVCACRNGAFSLPGGMILDCFDAVQYSNRRPLTSTSDPAKRIAASVKPCTPKQQEPLIVLWMNIERNKKVSSLAAIDRILKAVTSRHYSSFVERSWFSSKPMTLSTSAVVYQVPRTSP